MDTIVIDPGHGGSDNKNRGISGVYYEHIGNLEFSLKLQKELSPYYNVILTRKDNSSLSLTNRAMVAIRNKARLFVSIHSNAFSDKSAGGTSVYYSINRPKNRDLARQVGEAVAKAYGIRFRGAKTRGSARHPGFDYYTVINIAANYSKLTKNETVYEVPHVLLVERAFHTNPSEEKLLLDSAVSAKAAKAMADTIRNYLKNESERGMDRMLKKGMRGSDVKNLQEMLIQLGYGGYMEPYGADGIFGDATEKAVLAFQKNNGLDQDGIVGPLTMDKIQELLRQAPGKSSSPRDFGEILGRTALLKSQVQDMGKKLVNLSVEMDTLAKELEVLTSAMKRL